VARISSSLAALLVCSWPDLGLQRGAHLGQAPLVALHHGLELLRQGVAQGAAQLQQLLGEGIDLGVLCARGFGCLL
jgi:hypothetical protein